MDEQNVDKLLESKFDICVFNCVMPKAKDARLMVFWSVRLKMTYSSLKCKAH